MTTSPRQERRSTLPLPLADRTVFSFRFTASPRGARLARRLASCQMDAWGWRYGTPAHDSVELIVAELANNAVTHERVPGRDAELLLTADRDDGLVRVEVSDTPGERGPRVGGGDPGGPGPAAGVRHLRHLGSRRTDRRARQDGVGRGRRPEEHHTPRRPAYGPVGGLPRDMCR